MATFTNFLKLYKPVTNEVGWDDNMNTNLDTLDGFVNQFMNIPGFVGAWVNATAYAVGNVTVDAVTGVFYRCNVANTSAATGTFAQDRTARPTLWTQTTTPSQDSAAAAAASATAAANSAASAATQLTSFQNTYYGAFATAPLTDPHGNARTTGDLYFDTTGLAMNVWSGTAWIPITAAFNDAPTTPAGTVFVRTAAHTWAVGVGQLGGDFTGPVHFGDRVSISNGNRTTTNMPLGTGIVDQLSAIGGLGSNMYFSVTPPFSPTVGGFRYITAAPNGGAGAFCFTHGTIGPGPNIPPQFVGIKQLTLFLPVTSDPSAPDGVVTTINPAVWQSNGNYIISGAGFQPGGGLWGASGSDLRLKTVVGPYPHGLAELLEMLPKLYTYKGNANAVNADGSMGAPLFPDTNKQYIGLIAQDCEPYMPELVTTTTMYVDGVLQTDVRQLDATGVIYALVNAVATLDARLKALEGP